MNEDQKKAALAGLIGRAATMGMFALAYVRYSDTWPQFANWATFMSGGNLDIARLDEIPMLVEALEAIADSAEETAGKVAQS